MLCATVILPLDNKPMVSRLIQWLSYPLDNFSQCFEQSGPDVLFLGHRLLLLEKKVLCIYLNMKVLYVKYRISKLLITLVSCTVVARL